mmetsp:Transcript_9708/g.28929  ORF Transcript_9708/g.28929 Transcript_9708/m.28929 type:complete len:273 (+) Transcript_9708:453-1271(+)
MPNPSVAIAQALLASSWVLKPSPFRRINSRDVWRRIPSAASLAAPFAACGRLLMMVAAAQTLLLSSCGLNRSKNPGSLSIMSLTSGKSSSSWPRSVPLFAKTQSGIDHSCGTSPELLLVLLLLGLFSLQSWLRFLCSADAIMLLTTYSKTVSLGLCVVASDHIRFDSSCCWNRLGSRPNAFADTASTSTPHSSDRAGIQEEADDEDDPDDALCFAISKMRDRTVLLLSLKSSSALSISTGTTELGGAILIFAMAHTTFDSSRAPKSTLPEGD